MMTQHANMQNSSELNHQQVNCIAIYSLRSEEAIVYPNQSNISNNIILQTILLGFMSREVSVHEMYKNVILPRFRKNSCM
jgi:hypothetical protein